MVGMLEPGKVLSGSLFSLFVMIWKFAVIQMVKVDTERAKYSPGQIWSSALKRLDSKIEAYARVARSKYVRANGLGRYPPPTTAFNPTLAPLAELDEAFGLNRHEHYSAQRCMN